MASIERVTAGELSIGDFISEVDDESLTTNEEINANYTAERGPHWQHVVAIDRHYVDLIKITTKDDEGVEHTSGGFPEQFVWRVDFAGDGTLGPCGCTDYHMSDCPLMTREHDDPPEEDDDRYSDDNDEWETCSWCTTLVKDDELIELVDGSRVCDECAEGTDLDTVDGN